MLKKFITLITITALSFTVAMAQNRTISGTVVDETGATLPGVAIVVEKTTTGTISDIDGNFSISITPETSFLVFTSIGYKTQRIDVTGKSVLNIKMEIDVTEISQVVVTALGISREKKSLGYSVQDINSDALSKTGETNILSSLGGKIAGLDISSSATGPGGSAQVIIRGASSLTGNNQPLFVIDGIPVNNYSFGGGNKDGGIDYGNAVSNINPDDIASISVLKGGNAAALYGSLGQNGVILITTKKGSGKSGLGIKFSSTFTLDQPYIWPDYQNTYSRGSNSSFVSGSNVSWGAKMTGQEVVDWTGKTINLNPVGNQAKEFFQSSYTIANDISLESGFEQGALRVSFSHLKNDNIMPNSTFEKMSFTVRGNTSLGKKLHIDTKINVIQQDAFNRPNLGGSPDNPIRTMYIMPRDVKLSDLSNYITETGYPVLWDNTLTSFNSQNPYWAINLNTNGDSRTRAIGFFSANIDFTPWLNLMIRTGIDTYFDNRLTRIAQNTAYKSTPDAQYTQDNFKMLETTNDFMLKAQKRFTKLSLIGSLGGSIFHRQQNGLSVQGAGQVNPGKYYINNFRSVTTSESISEKEIQSLYGYASFGFDDQIYLDLTARNDWSSALTYSDGTGKNSYFYSSASLSWLLNETLSLPAIISLSKLRLSYAEVGNDTDPNRLEKVYATSVGHNGQNYTVLPRINPPFNLKPERTKTMEAGLEIALWKGRLAFDISAYKMGTENQIFSPRVAPSSGFDYALINSGLIDNKGIELQISGQPIAKKLIWNVSFNFSRNFSEVKEMAQEVTVLPIGGDEHVVIMAMLNEPNGNIVGKKFSRDAAGNLILDANGLPDAQKDEKGNPVDAVLGNINPDWIAGLSNTLSYKNFNFSLMIDSKWGAEIFSLSNAYGSRFGTLENTIAGRDLWASSEADRVTLGIPTANWTPTGGLKMEGVDAAGNPVVKFINPQSYWNKVAGDNIITEAFIYDASFIRIKEISLGFNLPSIFITKLGISGLRFSIVGKNLGYIYRKTPGFIPESSYNASYGAKGIEKFAFPATRNFGFRLDINF